MSKLIWDNTGERFYETGVKQCVLYKKNAQGAYANGVAWNGITAVSESPSGAEPTALYADDVKYLNLISAEEFAASIEAYTYPEEFEECDGSAEIAPGVSIGQQNRKEFGFCYKTVFGNDTDGNEHGYKLHLVYNALAAPSEKGYSSINDSPEAITFSWEVSTTPVNVTGKKPTACLTINSDRVNKEKLAALEAILYGSETSEPRMPFPDEIVEIMGGTVTFYIAGDKYEVESGMTWGEWVVSKYNTSKYGTGEEGLLDLGYGEIGYADGGVETYVIDPTTIQEEIDDGRVKDSDVIVKDRHYELN